MDKINIDRLVLLKWHYYSKVRVAKQELDSLTDKLKFLEQCEEEAKLVKETTPLPNNTPAPSC